MIAYRKDIDGLRGLAVIAVVGFHAFPALVPGGFVGVDIFFVISGYLISAIIFGDLNANTFSFREFYSRRVKRIFPALVVVLTASYLIGWFFLLADEYEQLGKHITSGAGFISNFIFWSEAGYFDNAADTKPLLHLWSLGVEEQFYIVWPFLLWAAWKTRLNLVAVSLCIALLSFAVNIATVQNHQAAAFYSPATRFWELMLGALLAYVSTRASGWPDRQIFRNLRSIAGLGFIGLAVVRITKDAPFPGWWALLPTVGTLLVASAGSRAWLNRAILGHRSLVWVGLISYPLYLWHWPLLSFARIVEGETPTAIVRTSIVLLSTLLAWATYRLIERPIRFGYRSTIKVGALSALMLVVGVVGFGSATFGGLPFREAANLTTIHEGAIDRAGVQAFFEYQNEHFYLCTPKELRDSSIYQGLYVRCLQSQPSEAKDVAIIGDSHAEHLFIGLSEELKTINFVYYIQNNSPFLSTGVLKEAFDYVQHDKNIRAVILAAFWPGRMYQIPAGSSFKDELTKTVEALLKSGKVVYLIEDTPVFPFDPRVCKYEQRRAFWDADSKTCVADKTLFNSLRNSYEPTLASVAAAFPGVHLLQTSDFFCNDSSCWMAKDHVMFFRDKDHLTIQGSKYFAKRLIEKYPALRAIAASKQ